jgi:hypothetical protein
VSDETYRAVEDALRAHMADENDGAYLVHWHLVSAGVVPADADRTVYQYANHDGAPHEWVGLLWMAQRRAMRWEASTDDD